MTPLPTTPQPVALREWTAVVSDDGRTLYLYFDGRPGCVSVKADYDGFVADMWPTGSDDGEAVASTWAFYSELAPVEAPAGEQP